VGRRYLEQLAAVPDAPLEVQRDVAIGYARIGGAEAVTSANATGDVRKGEAALAQSETLLRDLLRRFPQRDDLRRELASTLALRAGVHLSAHNDAAAATKTLDEAFSLYDEVLRRAPDDMDAAYGRWNAVMARGDLLADDRQYDAVILLMNTTLEQNRDLPVPERLRSYRALYEAASENFLGNATYYLKKAPEVYIAHYQRAVDLLEAARAQGVMDMRLPMREAGYDYQMSGSFQEMGRLQPALEWAERGKELIDGLARYDDSTGTRHYVNILALQHASVLNDLGQPKEAIAEMEAGITLRRQFAARQPDDLDRQSHLVSGLHILADQYMKAGEPVEACRVVHEALSIYDRLEKSSGVSKYYKQEDGVPLREMAAKCPP
jgi:tetratricopeptide (TPR) repeat protein